MSHGDTLEVAQPHWHWYRVLPICLDVGAVNSLASAVAFEKNDRMSIFVAFMDLRRSLCSRWIHQQYF